MEAIKRYLKDDLAKGKILCAGRVTERNFHTRKLLIIKYSLYAPYVTERKIEYMKAIKGILNRDLAKGKILYAGRVIKRNFFLVND